MVLKIRKPYAPRERLPFECQGPSMTRQSEMPSCDINRIMAKYQKTGVLEHARIHQGRYGDFIGAPEYQEAVNQVIAAQDAFASLPSSVRKKFDNDPAAFLAFAQDPANLDAMVDLGLASRPDPVVDPAPSTSTEPASSPEG